MLAAIGLFTGNRAYYAFAAIFLFEEFVETTVMKLALRARS